MTDRKKQKTVGGSILAAMVSLFLAAGVLADWNTAGRSINVLTSTAYRAEIEEEYKIPSHVSPGTSVDKTVHVVNSGNTDMFVRLKVTKGFGTRRTDGTLDKDPELDPELIEISYNQEYWKYLDGYWYYTDVLRAGEKTKQPLFEQYTVSYKADNAYKKKDAEIVVMMESIQAEGDAVSLWGIRKKDLGITYALPKKDTVTSVTFRGRERGFSFSRTDTDLFANFKNLLPGCSRTQKITIVNESEEAILLTLRADTVSQSELSGEEKKKADKLLSEYAQITVKQGKKILYQGSVNGKSQSTGQNMREEISLGRLDAGELRDLIVTLSVSPEMEQDMQKLTGKVQWIFTAGGREQKGAPISGKVPQTADETELLWPMFGIMCGSMLFLLTVYLRRKHV